MNRRNFISNLGLASGGLLVKQFSPALAEKKVKIYDNYIRGLQYYQYDKLKSRLEPGQEIQLIREMENPYDHLIVPDHAIIQSSLTTKRADEAEDIYRGSF
ncbi:MAG: hypothetical protein BRD49_00060 [Bacteroidetes bacterium SW_10_40_5]|nr:MAG: hypothetical protein BRD49_00060 [Bacteroidetes bacterium SW_10_40_5]